MASHLVATELPPETAADEALAFDLSLAEKPSFADLPDEVSR
jgi:hypothetical protein